WVLGRVLTELGFSVVAALGLYWGGALAQQFAFQNPRRCRRLILAATGTGVLMVPGRLGVLSKMLTPRRFSDPEYAAAIARELYGGVVRQHDRDVSVRRIEGRRNQSTAARSSLQRGQIAGKLVLLTTFSSTIEIGNLQHHGGAVRR